MTVDLDMLGQPFPAQAIKQREGGGGRRFSYIETHTVIHRLNAATGNNWNFRVVNQEWRNDLLIVVGELEILGCGARQGIGVQKVSERGGEDLIKGAASDALKKAATLFGIALDLYGPDYESGEIAPQQSAPLTPHPQTRQAQSAPMRTAEDTNFATDKQIAAISAIGTNLGWTTEELRAEMHKKYGKRSRKDLTVREASDFITHLNEGAPKAQPELING